MLPLVSLVLGFSTLPAVGGAVPVVRAGECVAKDAKYAAACRAFDEAPCRAQSLVCEWCDAGASCLAESFTEGGPPASDEPELPRPCMAEYLEREPHFLEVSGAWLRVKRKEHIVASYWKEYVSSLQGFSETGEIMGQWDTEWMHFLYTGASEQILVCWGMNGAYWDAWVRRPPGELAVGKWTSSELSSSVCVPLQCTQQEVEEEILPHFFANKLLKTGIHVTPEKVGHAVAHAVSHWADLSLDFAILGVDGCGTTSLRQNLAKHPSIAFTNFSVHAEDEDWFMNELGKRTLPLQSHRELLEEAKERRPSRLLGTYNPLLWSELTTYFMLSMKPELRFVFMVCDPVDRFEKRSYMRMQETGESFQDAATAEMKDSRLEIGPRLRAWQELGSRTLFLHVGDLRSKPEETYRRLTDFLGVVPFSRKMSYHRYNSISGHRTRLCENATRVQQLQTIFAHEYEALEEVLSAQSTGEELPAELRLRQTRCQRLAELQHPEEGCEYKGACQL